MINSDDVIINNTLIYNNTSQLDGGGLFVTGTIKLINSTIVGNTVPAGRYGAAMEISTGLESTLLLNNIFYNNYGHPDYSSDDGIAG